MSGLDTVFAVMMVGHSLFGSDGPDMLQEALRTGRGEGNVSAQIINGAPLKYNWENSDQEEGVDARAQLPRGDTTHLILTEALPLQNHITWSDSSLYAQAFARLAISTNPQAHVYVQETWHSLRSGTGVAVEHDDKADIPWRTRLDQDLPLWQSIVSDVQAGNQSDKATVSLIPAGQAMARLYDQIAADAVLGISNISALFSDDIHLNDTGHYFVAMVQYGTLTGQSPLGLPVDFNDRWGRGFDTPDPDLARELQRVAWETVQSFGGQDIAPVPLAPAKTDAPQKGLAAPAVLPDAPQDAVPGTRDVAIGLAAVKDWSAQQPFLDLMKTARPWLGHKPGQYGGMEYAELQAGGHLGAEGWPIRMPRSLSSIGSLILTDMPFAATSLKGRYVLRYEGKGVIEVAGRATGVRYGKNSVSFDYEPGPGSVEIRIQRINTRTPPRNIRISKEDHVALLDQGAVFNPAWTARMGAFKGLRFMDWQEINDSTLSRWQDRPLPSDVSFANGVPIEVLVQLANELGVDPWFNVPHLADDDFVRSFATLVREELDPSLKAYVEFSNEVWNWQFTQAVWADDMARARWGQDDKWMQYYGLRAAEVARIWSEVFGDQAAARLVNVVSSQTGWLGLESEVLEAPLLVAEGVARPASAFDAYAISGYFGGILGLSERAVVVKDWIAQSRQAAEAAAREAGLEGKDAAGYIAQHRYDAATLRAARDLRDGAVSGDPADTLSDLLGRVWPHHAAVAQHHGLALVMYEGGSHVVGIGAEVEDAELAAFFHHLNYSAEMGGLYQQLLEGWTAVGGQLFNAYSDVYAPTKWGSWGALRHLDDQNPRWDALVGYP